jgi:hypothetical protein
MTLYFSLSVFSDFQLLISAVYSIFSVSLWLALNNIINLDATDSLIDN